MDRAARRLGGPGEPDEEIRHRGGAHLGQKAAAGSVSDEPDVHGGQPMPLSFELDDEPAEPRRLEDGAVGRQRTIDPRTQQRERS